MANKRNTTSRVRIIAGEFGGRSIEAPSASVAHVMGERERGAIFNALFSMNGIEGARVLDMFAGSGALGLEALSRGASSVDFVENNAKTRGIIKRNVQILFQTDCSSTTSKTPVATGVFASRSRAAALRKPLAVGPQQNLPIGEPLAIDLRMASASGTEVASVSTTLQTGEIYDVIFSDAPYDRPQWELVVKLPEMLAEGGRLVVSHAKNEPIPDFAAEKFAAEDLRNVYSKTFAGAQIDIFVK